MYCWADQAKKKAGCTLTVAEDDFVKLVGGEVRCGCWCCWCCVRVWPI